jgi:hypothetical protein
LTTPTLPDIISAVHRGFITALLALGGCTVVVPDRSDRELLAAIPAPIRDTGDVDMMAGQYVALDGVLGSHDGYHAYLSLPSGLIVHVPRFHEFAVRTGRTAWFDLVGRPVRVAGFLHAATIDIPGVKGPSVRIHEFAPWP